MTGRRTAPRGQTHDAPAAHSLCRTSLPHVHLEIAKAIQTLAAEDDRRIENGVALVKTHNDLEPIADIVREALRILRKRGFNFDEPRVPAGSPYGGQWTAEGGGSPSATPRAVLSDATPDNNWIPGAQYAANDPPGIGHNQGPPLGEPPEIPPQLPSTKQAVNAFLKAAAYWLAEAGLAGEPVGDFILALQAVRWLSNYLPYVYSYLDPPKTLEELQQDASSPQVGYNIHHVVEQTSAAQDGFPRSMIDAPENLVCVSTFVHWQINAWYSTPNENFGGLSPRNYLRGRSWDERWQVGIIALRLFGVLAP